MYIAFYSSRKMEEVHADDSDEALRIAQGTAEMNKDFGHLTSLVKLVKTEIVFSQS